MSDELTAIVIVAAIAAAVVTLVVLVGRRRNRAIRDMLLPIVTAAGWADVRPASFGWIGLRGVWRSYPVELAYAARQKSVPQRFILRVKAPSSSRLSVKRRMYGFLTRPFTMFGPPLVEMRHPGAQELWVRADDMALAERVFFDDKTARLIAGNLVAAYDEVLVNSKGVRITRSLDDRPVRKKYDFAMVTMSFDPQRFAPIIHEEIALAEALVDKISR
ncbi:MAG TPA: hypothetical protein VLU46_13800 [Thermoanaerobaculia bacterium]|nr:hypothetical protein [Thermoanaerobaculia bacterium]